MKILFWLLAILSIPVGFFMSFCSFAIQGLGLASNIIGDVVCIAGMLSVIVSVICMVWGVILLRKKNAKKAVFVALSGLVYSGLILAGIYIGDAVDTMQHNKRIAEEEVRLYGENWDAPSGIEGIPESYERILNKYYAVVRDEWPAENLMEFGALSMPDYYGDASLDNIGFALMDLNCDDVDELVIGTTAPVDGGNVIFCVYSDPQNPHYSINSIECETHYLHDGEAEGLYTVEIVEHAAAWVLKPASPEDLFDFEYREGAMDPAGRLTVELTPFSAYK